MQLYNIGDYVLIRAKVIGVELGEGIDVNYKVVLENKNLEQLHCDSKRAIIVDEGEILEESP